MKLGLGSIAFIHDNIINGNFSDSINLLLDAVNKTLEFAEINDIEVVEIMLDPPKILLDEKREDFIILCNNYPSIKKQFHAPYTFLSLNTHNPWILNATIECYTECAKLLHQIGGKVYTFHPGDAKFLHQSYNHKKDILVESSRIFIEKIKHLDLVSCIENLPRFCGYFQYYDEIINFFNEIQRDEIYFTWDTGHYWSCNDNSYEQLWEILYKKIRNIHLVENNEKTTDIHPALGNGLVDFELVFELTEKYDYQGSMIMELHRVEDLSESIEYVRNFI